jgi:hypothetical protein
MDFSSVRDYIAHMSLCDEKATQEKEQEETLKKVAEKSARYAQVEESRKKYLELQTAFVRDYPEEPAKKYFGTNYALLINGKRQPDEVADKFFSKLDSVPFPGWF